MAVPITAAMQNQIAQNYIAILGRNPDPLGFSFWVQTYADAGGTPAALTSITNGFGNSAEFKATYAGDTTSVAVGKLYQNVLLRAADAGGLAYWTSYANNLIASGQTISNAYAQTGAQMIYNASSQGSSDAAGINARTATAVASGVAAPTTTYTLTTSAPETIIAQGANTVVQGLLGTGATLQSFDTVTGTGTTTFNLADNTAGAFPGIPVAATLSGFGTVNLIRSGAAAASNAVTIDNTTFGTGVKALNLSNAGDLTTAAGVSITLASASSVSVVNAAATAYTTVAVTDTATTVTTGSTLTTVSITGSSGAATLTGNGITTVNLNAAATGGTVTITAAAATRALTVNISGTTASGAVTDAQATSLTLNQSAAATVGTVTVAKATTITVNTTGAATTAGAETIVGTVATAMTFGGTRANTVTMTAANNPVLATVTVTGTGGVTLGDLAAFTTLTSVDTSGATNVASATGAANLTVANSVTLGTVTAFNGGAGSDTVTVGATTKAINLGTGSNTVNLVNGTTALGSGGSITGDGNDTLAFATAADAASINGTAATATAFKAAVTGFSTLQLAAVGTGTAINVNNFAATGVITQVNLTGNAAANVTTISNLGSGATIKVTGANTGAGTTTAGTTGSGVSDVLNLNLTQATGTLVAFGTFTTPNVEFINFIMGDTQATPTGTYNTATLTNTSVNTINVSGNNGLNLGTVTGATNLQTFNASALTLGGVIVTSDALQFASTVTGSQKGGDTLNFAAALAAVTVTTTAGTNTVSGSSTVASIFTGGSGVDTFFGGTGADTVNGAAGGDVLYGNNAGTKQIQIATLATALTATQTVNLTIAGTSITLTGGAGVATVDEVGAAFVTAINGNAALKFITTASYDAATDVLSLTNIVDGVISVARTSSASLTITLGTIGTDAGTRTGTSTTTGADLITGGSGADTFVFGISSAAPSATALQTITDLNAGGTVDNVFYAPTLVALAGAQATAVGGTAAISSSGIATFVSGDQVSLAAQLTAVAAAITAGTTAQGESVAFQFGSDAYIFISNGTDGVQAGDVLVKLTGVSTTSTAFDVLSASGHTLQLT